MIEKCDKIKGEFMHNIKLTLRFDGSAYHGWQVQPEDVTVSETVAKAIFDVTGECVNLVGCGRTDAHVHAYNYVCNFKTNTSIPPEKFAYALNFRLPDDIVCVSSEAVDMDFHAKSCAKKKNYVYKVLNTRFPNPFMNGRVWHVKGKLDIEAMKLAAESFVGTHDFRGFASSGLSVKTTVRTIYSLQVNEDDGVVSIDVVGNGFLYNMVRIIAGTLVWVGLGRIKAEDMADIIKSCDRDRAGMTAPPDGLYLWGVEY